MKSVTSAVRAKLARTIVARCRPGESAEERRAFAEELERAKKAFSGTELARELEVARSARRTGAELR